jgi:hypothetical protein
MLRVVVRGLKRQLELEASQQLVRETIQPQEQTCSQSREYNQFKFLAMSLNNLLQHKYLFIKYLQSKSK